MSGSEYRMAALDQKKIADHSDLMTVGPGTPWEDRGAAGSVSSFFKTCFMSLASPGKLLAQMRRPGTTSDVTAFVVWCGFFWAASVVVHSVFDYMHWSDPQVTSRERMDFSPQQFWVNTAIQAGAAWVGTWAALKFAAGVYRKLIQHDMTQVAPPPLVYNAMGYGLGPSILAVIPFAGPVLAGVWIFAAWVVVGRNRMRTKPGGAMVAAVLTSLATVAVIAAVYFAGAIAGSYLVDLRSVTPMPPRFSP